MVYAAGKSNATSILLTLCPGFKFFTPNFKSAYLSLLNIVLAAIVPGRQTVPIRLVGSVSGMFPDAMEYPTRPEKVGCRKESYFLDFMYVDVARDFVGVIFHVLLDGAKGSHNHRDCCCFQPPHSLNLDLLSYSVVLTEVLVSRGIVMSMRRQVLSFLFFSTMPDLLAAMVLSVWMGMSHRMVTLYFSVTVFSSCSYHRSFTSMPNSLQIFQCMCAAALLWRWMYSVLASSGQPETR